MLTVLVGIDPTNPNFQPTGRKHIDENVFDTVFFSPNVTCFATASLAVVHQKSHITSLREMHPDEELFTTLSSAAAAQTDTVAKWRFVAAAKLDAYSLPILQELEDATPFKQEGLHTTLVVLEYAPLVGALAHSIVKKSSGLDTIAAVLQLRLKPGDGFTAIFNDDGSLLSFEVLT